MGKIKVLVVDDDMKFAKNIETYLNLVGYEASISGTGEGAIQFIEKNKPDILLCDLKLLDIDGEQVIRKTKEISPKTVSFIISAYIDSSVEERLKNLDVYAFIHKPVLFDDVVALFKRAIP